MYYDNIIMPIIESFELVKHRFVPVKSNFGPPEGTDITSFKINFKCRFS